MTPVMRSFSPVWRPSTTSSLRGVVILLGSTIPFPMELDHPFFMPVGMALDVDCHRQAGNVTGDHLHVHCQGSNPSPIPLGANPQIVDAVEEGILYRGDLGIRVFAPDRTQEGLLCYQGRLVKGAADPH